MRPGPARRPWLAVGVALAAAISAAWAFGPRPGTSPQRVAAGVHLGENAVGGMATADVRTLLATLSPQSRVPPVEPRYDADTRGNVPGLDGIELDVEGTLSALLKAAPGSSLGYVYRAIPPAKTLADLPLAPIYRGNPEKPAVAVLINVAWGNEWIGPLLDVLNRHQAKATWFLMGDWAKANPDLAGEIARQGHEIASHGYSAVEWDRLGRQQMLDQISRADQAIEAATRVRPFWFSTHKGVVNEGILRAARDLGHETVTWTVDTVDWRKPAVDWMVSRVLQRAGPGALILMHPTERTPEALDRILTGLEARGLESVVLSDLLSPKRLPVQPAPAGPSE